MTATTTRFSTAVQGRAESADELSDGHTMARELPGFGCCGWSTTPTPQPLQSALSNYRTGGDCSPPASRPLASAAPEGKQRDGSTEIRHPMRGSAPSSDPRPSPAPAPASASASAPFRSPRLSNASCHLRGLSQTVCRKT